MKEQNQSSSIFKRADNVNVLILVLVGLILVPFPAARGQVGWGAPASLNTNATVDTGGDFNIAVAKNGQGNWVAVWSSNENIGGGIGTDFDILFSLSSDGGQTWSSPAALNSGAGSDVANDYRPSISFGENGQWLVVWDSGTAFADFDIFVSRSSDAGQTWSAANQVSEPGGADIATDMNATIDTDGAGKWMVLWDSTENVSGAIGTDQDILISVSQDNGGSWSAPNALNSNAAVDDESDFGPSIASDGMGNWIAAWSVFEDILYSRSTDNGNSWTASINVVGGTFPNDGADFSPRIFTDRDGTWLLVWESGDTLNNAIGDDQDVLVVRSVDAGANWSTVAALNGTASTDSNNDSNMDSSPSLSVDRDGNWIAIWQSDSNVNGALGTDTDILTAYSIDDGVTWSAPFSINTSGAYDTGDESGPVLAYAGAGNWLAFWSSGGDATQATGGDSDLFVASVSMPLLWSAPAVLNSNHANDSNRDGFPQVASDGQGNLVVVWQSRENLNGNAGTDIDMFVSHSADGGATWSPVSLLNSNGNTDVGDDRNPRLVMNESGLCVAIWDSPENLGGNVGTDQDIFVTRSLDRGVTWSPVEVLNSNAGNDADSDFGSNLKVDKNGTVVAVWMSDNSLGNTIGNDNDILFAVSTDSGITWSPPGPLNSTAAVDTGDDFDPFVATDDSGRWIVAWMSNDAMNNTIGTDDDILFTVSSDNGLTWSAADTLNVNAAVDGAEDDDFWPHLATDALGNWVAIWHSEGTLGGTVGKDLDILYSRSIDDGLTWSSVAPLNSNATFDSEDDDFPTLVYDDGLWLVSWTSREAGIGGSAGFAGETEIAYSFSRDEGANWTPASALNSDAMISDATDYNVSIASASSRGWIGVWTSTENLIGADGDLFFALASIPNSSPILQVGADQVVDEGTVVALSGATFSDANLSDVHSAEVDWGDGMIEPASVDQVSRAISGSHSYPDEGVYVVSVSVGDGQGGIDMKSFMVTVNNVAPSVGAGPDVTIDEGQIVNLAPAAFVDPGILDLHTSVIDWDDGGIEAGVVSQSARTVAGSHRYDDDGAYMVHVGVEDDDGGQGLDAFVVTVRNVAPTVNAGADHLTQVGDEIKLGGASFSDPGNHDTHTAIIEWGDGDIEAGGIDQISGIISGAHTYFSEGTFTVVVTVSDDDNDSSSDTFDVVVKKNNANSTPLVITGLSGQGNMLTLSWTGGSAPYQVQTRKTVVDSWQDFGATTDLESISFVPTGSEAYFRVVSLP